MEIRGPFELDFKVDKYGPYSDKIWHLLNPLDGTYLNCSKRLSDASLTDSIWFDEMRRTIVDLYLHQESSTDLRRILDLTTARIDGFESPLGMELLATVDWLVEKEHRDVTVSDIRRGLQEWPAGDAAAERKLRLFDDRLIGLALRQLAVDHSGAI